MIAIASLFFLLSGSHKPAVPTISLPLQKTVFQRNDSNIGSVVITGTMSSSWSTIQAQAVPTNGGTAVFWTNIASTYTGAHFTGALPLSPGLYTISVRSTQAGNYSQATQISNIGVGENFLCFGQSLMGNWGFNANSVTDPRVFAVNLTTGVWQTANDPQPTADGGNGSGSPIPAIGSALAVRLNMPIGFIDGAVGGTSLAQWISTYYASRILPAIRLFGNTGFRAILWEQGQQDGASGTPTATWEAEISTLISQSRTDAGWVVPWGIADTSTIQTNTAYPLIQTAQAWAVANITAAFAGSNTDSITLLDRPDGTHLNAAGQLLQGGFWATGIETYFSF